jgi:hypothetical protein
MDDDDDDREIDYNTNKATRKSFDCGGCVSML